MIKNWQYILRTKLHVNGMTLFPFVLISDKKLLQDKVFVNHEHIHLRQQLEMLILPFYMLYGLHYIINRFRYKTHHAAYRNIVFEREAYANEKNPGYLKTRRVWNWMRYF